jgi:hypothetical protein
VYYRAGSLRRVHDISSVLIQYRVIIRFHPNSNDFARLS